MSLPLQTILAWIKWDPPRFAFTVPFLERDVAWYGIFFSLGFLLGFLLIIPIFQKRLLQNKEILDRDIANWPLLLTFLRKENDPDLKSIFHKLSSKSQDLIKQFK